MLQKVVHATNERGEPCKRWANMSCARDDDDLFALRRCARSAGEFRSEQEVLLLDAGRWRNTLACPTWCQMRASVLAISSAGNLVLQAQDPVLSRKQVHVRVPGPRRNPVFWCCRQLFCEEQSSEQLVGMFSLLEVRRRVRECLRPICSAVPYARVRGKAIQAGGRRRLNAAVAHSRQSAEVVDVMPEAVRVKIRESWVKRRSSVYDRGASLTPAGLELLHSLQELHGSDEAMLLRKLIEAQANQDRNGGRLKLMRREQACRDALRMIEPGILRSELFVVAMGDIPLRVASLWSRRRRCILFCLACSCFVAGIVTSVSRRFDRLTCRRSNWSWSFGDAIEMAWLRATSKCILGTTCRLFTPRVSGHWLPNPTRVRACVAMWRWSSCSEGSRGKRVRRVQSLRCFRRGRTRIACILAGISCATTSGISSSTRPPRSPCWSRWITCR
jgi:hypothetical protein